jgi:hypothetical protein
VRRWILETGMAGQWWVVSTHCDRLLLSASLWPCPGVASEPWEATCTMSTTWLRPSFSLGLWVPCWESLAS